MSLSNAGKTACERPVMLIIRDGWGVSPGGVARIDVEGNATLMAKTPVQNALLAQNPWSFLEASGEAVGLPAGQMGNSEVGHLNLGAGRVVYQDLTRITKSIRDGDFFAVPAFKQLLGNVAANGTRLHLMGLCSDGGVHSHMDHLYALIDLAGRSNVKNLFVHCFTDGRDTSPTSGVEHIGQLGKFLQERGFGQIATITGRYFAMDRDNRWERTQKAYDCLTRGEGVRFDDGVAAMKHWYAKGTTDEFIPASVVSSAGQQTTAGTIRDGDGVIFFNFRSDRTRQITRALTQESFDGFKRVESPKVQFVCMTEYDETFNLPIAFPATRLINILGQVLAGAGIPQLRAAETEKYPHVTFFFNGGEEKPFPGEDRCLIPSPKVATYDLKPEMSAHEVTAEIIARLKTRKYGAFILNFANPDMVGHTGVIPAAIKAVETVDHCVGQVLSALRDVNGVALVTADHGNAERMLDDNGQPHTAHTCNPVHLFYVGADQGAWKLKPGALCDIAPTLLQMLRLPVPKEMTGSNLLIAAREK